MKLPGHLTLLKLSYLLLAGLPLLVAALAHNRAGRGLWIELGVGLGFVGFSVLALQFALTGKFRHLSVVLGLDALLHFHRQIGLVAFGLILAHVGILSAADSNYAAFLDPRVDWMRALALWVVLGALILLIVTTYWRIPLGIPYEWWRIGHGMLALAVLSIGLAHILRVGWYVDEPWKQSIWIAGTLCAVGLLVYARVWKPYRARRRRWTVNAVRPEKGDAWTLELVPDGHEGMRFRAGQFVWLVLGDSPFSQHQHPFSISSSEHRTPELEITVKALGDFTSRIGEVEVGTHAYIDGPYGSFVLDDATEEVVCVAGGVGITPIMSILRTMRDSGREIPVTLVYGFPAPDQAILLKELEELAHETGWLDLVRLAEYAEPDWTGERGLVTPEFLDRHLPPEAPGLRYFICGPDPMMDGVESYLSSKGVPLERVRSERFNIA